MEDNLIGHPAVLLDPEWCSLASRAAEPSADLDQPIGRRPGEA